MATVDTLFSFAFDTQRGNATGAFPLPGLIADAQGNLYGTTQQGGANETGAVYELVKGANGYTQQTLFSFDANTSTGNATGITPFAGLTADSQGNLYGTTIQGGANNGGTVFELVKGANGYAQKTLYSFPVDPRANAVEISARSGLLADAQGNLYGTTYTGGVNDNGTVYELVKGANGFSQRTLFSFDSGAYSGNTTGSGPKGNLISDAEGNLYGTTLVGGKSGYGAVYELVKGPNGYSQKNLFSFDNPNSGTAGATPDSGLTADAQGNLYGTTKLGGANGLGTVYELVKGPSGYSHKILYSFDATANNNGGFLSPGQLTIDGQGNIYGTTHSSNADSSGTVYELVNGPNGYSKRTLFSFDPATSHGNATGSYPNHSLTPDGQGNFFGTTQQGGSNNYGAVFRVSNIDAGSPTQPTNPVTTNPVATNPDTTNVMAANSAATNPAPTKPATANPTPPANNAPCYCTGTRIQTDRGPIAVEDLAIGDRVVTAGGAHRPIRWIGTRSYGGRFANTNPAVLPVCVKAGALAEAVPVRDLWVSPEHALFLDGVLVPAELLVNGTSIEKAERVEAVTYWHIELDSHDVLLAEGAPAESFVDDGGRAIFHNAATYRALYPHAPAWTGKAAYCAPRVTEGFALEAIRRRLALRAGLPVAPARTFGALRGHLDLCAAGADGTLRVVGWAWDLAHPDGPVCLDVMVDGAVVGLAYAETFRTDLAAAGIGDGRHGFDVTLALRGLSSESTVVLRRSADGAMLGTARPAASIGLAA
ncbi:Hint domain-containing protein [Methylobacterium sp. E-005]|uniref:choice-of-anchor tandem repeat GloVer-containing protein n=1 Tax=Methylobacterium sp. E-005 TaxID=2836549 RepID=UPI001FBB4B1D|nr:choice-of-anchor tandem repeat GloVer-containing protein [Methylobacterium sp. E-005]MCJ2088231.1 Hint domain-containing protein [Methylobacterium sp. E-005]